MPDATFIPFFENLPAPVENPSQAKGPFTAMSPAPPAGSAAKHSGASHPQGEPHRPTIKLQKDGDKIRSIRIECVCGQIIELDCVY